MTPKEIKYVVKLTLAIEASEVNCLQDAYSFGTEEERSVIDREDINNIYTIACKNIQF